MKAGDWVVVFRSVWNMAAGHYVEMNARTARITRRTPTQILADCSIHPFKLKDGAWEQKCHLHNEVTCLRPATAEEIQRGEDAERKRAEAAQKHKEEVNAMRVALAEIDWATLDDLTVETAHRMATDRRNRIPQPKKKGVKR